MDAVKNKINEFGSTPECSLTQDEQATLNEVYGQLKLPSVASLDSGFSENYSPATLLAVLSKWPEDKRFPRKCAIIRNPMEGAHVELSDSDRPLSGTLCI